jgi:hypothetical protein
VHPLLIMFLRTTIYSESLVDLCRIFTKQILLGVGIQYCDVMSRYPRRWDGCVGVMGMFCMTLGNLWDVGYCGQILCAVLSDRGRRSGDIASE